MWNSILQWLSSNFMPHGHCYRWQPEMIGLQVATNLAIGVAYLFISLTLVHLVRRIRTLPFEWMYLAFGIFIVACGFTHFMDVVVIWAPLYWLDGGLRAVTAVASVGTAVLLFPLVRKAATLGDVVEQRKRSDEVLRRSEEQFRLLVESVQGYAIFMLDTSGRVISWNSGAQRCKGYTEAEILGASFSVFYPSEDITAGKPEHELRAAATQGRIEDEGWRVRKDGTNFWATVVITALRDEHGRLLGFAKIVRDITDRKRAEVLAQERGVRIESLNYELAALLDTLFQTAPIGLGYLDRDLRYVRINDRLAEMNGLTVKEHLGRRVDEILLGLAQARAELQQVLDSGEPAIDLELGCEMPAQPGRWRYWLASYYPVLVKGQAIGVGAVVHEITERKQAEIEHGRLLQQAQEGVRAREVFLAVAAHELRTPLAPLRIVIQGLLRRFRPGNLERTPPGLVSRLEIVDRQIDRLDRLVNDLLDVSRIAAGQLVLSPEKVDLAAVVREVAQRHTEESRQAGSSLALACSDGPIIGNWDRARVEQVVTNMLTNAIKYGLGRPIRLAVRAGADTAAFIVIDEGCGIAPENQQRIFECFERAGSPRHYGGLGLGLWIAQQAVAAMDGSIKVQSQMGLGSTFTVELPRRL